MVPIFSAIAYNRTHGIGTKILLFHGTKIPYPQLPTLLLWAILTMEGAGEQCCARAHHSWSVNKHVLLNTFMGIREGCFETYLSLSIETVNPMIDLFLSAAAAVATLSDATSTATKCLALMRRKKKRSRKDMFSAASQCCSRPWTKGLEGQHGRQLEEGKSR